MYQFLHPRNRPLQSLILGLIVLTFYAYYRTTFYDIHQFGSARNFSHAIYQDALRNQSNHSIDIQSMPKNMTYEPLTLNSYSQHNASNPATIITTLSTSSSSQVLSSVSTSLNRTHTRKMSRFWQRNGLGYYYNVSTYACGSKDSNQANLKLEDVFMTGIVAHKLGIKRVQANEFLNKRIAYSL